MVDIPFNGLIVIGSAQMRQTVLNKVKHMLGYTFAWVRGCVRASHAHQTHAGLFVYTRLCLCIYFDLSRLRLPSRPLTHARALTRRFFDPALFHGSASQRPARLRPRRHGMDGPVQSTVRRPAGGKIRPRLHVGRGAALRARRRQSVPWYSQMIALFTCVSGH